MLEKEDGSISAASASEESFEKLKNDHLTKNTPMEWTCLENNQFRVPFAGAHIY